tara:strand:+ start:479 stop:640 length:162 start_codon:yes stop_codon:yes gene_type:complete
MKFFQDKESTERSEGIGFLWDAPKIYGGARDHGGTPYIYSIHIHFWKVWGVNQ